MHAQNRDSRQKNWRLSRFASVFPPRLFAGSSRPGPVQGPPGAPPANEPFPQSRLCPARGLSRGLEFVSETGCETIRSKKQ